MPRMFKAEALEILKNRPLYNVDFQAAKRFLSLAFENAYRDQVREPFFWAGKFEDLPAEIHELNYLDWSLHRVPGLQKKVRACKVDNPCLTAMILLLNDWEEAALTVAAAKKDAIKGRKPSTDPRKTPERTLENTGTCPVCGKNVKMLGGNLVDHGFQLAWGQRQGLCLGVGKLPWEVSPAGKIYFVEVLKSELAKLHEDMEGLQCEPDADPAEMQLELAATESGIRFVKRSIELTQKEIDDWKEQPLPGEKYAKA